MPKQANSSSPSTRPVSGTDSGSAGFAGLAASADNPPFNLANHFLIAMPCMSDSVFNRSVVYLCEHHAGGALGVIINKPTDVSVDALFERLELRLEINVQDGLRPQSPVMFGGPVQGDRGFVLHPPGNAYSSSLTISDQVALTTSRDVLQAFAEGNGPHRMLISLGCAGWDSGQLEQEILRNDWLTVRADPAILFETPVEQRFDAAMHLLGIDPGMLSGEAGHA